MHLMARIFKENLVLLLLLTKLNLNIINIVDILCIKTNRKIVKYLTTQIYWQIEYKVNSKEFCIPHGAMHLFASSQFGIIIVLKISISGIN